MKSILNTLVFLVILSFIGYLIYKHDSYEQTKTTISWIESRDGEIRGLKFENHFRKWVGGRGNQYGDLQTKYIISLKNGEDYYLTAPHRSMVNIKSDDLSGEALVSFIKKYQDDHSGVWAKFRRGLRTDNDNFIINPWPIDHEAERKPLEE